MLYVKYDSGVDDVQNLNQLYNNFGHKQWLRNVA